MLALLKTNFKISTIDIVYWGIVYCFILYAFEGPIRFYSDKVSFREFIYTKDIVLLALGTLLVFRVDDRVLTSRIVVIYIYVMSLFGLVALLNGLPIKQVFLAYKIYLILFVGIQSYRLLPELGPRLLKAMNCLALFSCLGLIINMFCSFPWEGVDMSIGNIIVDTSRTAYAAGGFKRVAGFGRNWSNPAYFALIATVLNYSYIKHIKFRHIILVLVFFIGILISTNKGAIITFLIISFFAVIIRKVPSYILKIVMLATLLIVIALPLLSWNEVLNVDYSSLVSRIIFSSFKARVEDVWPQALILIKEHGSLIFGRGIGGIGAPQLIFEPSIYHPADNLFIYLYGLFGVFSCVIFAYLGVKIMVLSIKDSRDTIFVAYLILSFLGIGVIGSALENGILNFFFGIMLASLYSQKIKFISSSVSDLPS